MATLISAGVELRFPEAISFHAQGGPSFSTTVVVSGSGKEQRTRNWLKERLKWDVAHAARLPSVYLPLAAFFRLCGGKANDFRFKDWTDFMADYTQGVIGLGVGTGMPTSQVGKLYTFAGASVVRPIYKVVPGSITVKFNGSLMTEGSAAGDWEIDLSKAIITFTASVTKTITAISKASSGVVTAASHGYTNGMLIYIGDVVGMTEINGMLATVASATTNTFATGINTTGFTTYASGGTAKKYPQPSDTLTAAFEFDIAARFDTDEMTGEIIDKSGGQFIMGWNSILIIEVRVL